jgi:hypothetical protein
MRITIRVAAAVLSLVGCAASLAPPVQAEPHISSAVAASPVVVAPPTEADMVGTWTGTVTLDGTSEPLDGGIITITRAEDRLAVTVGPNHRVRHSCVRLARTERGLRFEVTLPNHDETRLLVYDVDFSDGAMTGTVTFVRHGLTAPAQLIFTRQ